MALSAGIKTLTAEAERRGVSTSGTTPAQAAATAERLAAQVDQGRIPGTRQGLRPAQGRGRRAATKKRTGRRRVKATRRSLRGLRRSS